MNTMRLALFKHLETSTIISKVYNGEDRVMAPEESKEAYVVLSELASQMDSPFLDNAGEYIYRVTVHVLRGDVDLGEHYLQSLTDLFRSRFSVEDEGSTYWYKARASDWGAWNLEEIDKTISRSRILVVPAWG